MPSFISELVGWFKSLNSLLMNKIISFQINSFTISLHCGDIMVKQTRKYYCFIKTNHVTFPFTSWEI